MIGREVLERKINELEDSANEVEVGAREFLEKAPIYKTQHKYSHTYHWDVPSEELGFLQREVIRKYQIWYNSAHNLIKEYIPEKLKEFTGNYQGQSYSRAFFDGLILRWSPDSTGRSKIVDQYIRSFEIQRSILLSIPSVVEINELNFRKIIVADVIESELDQAELLFRNGFERAAGAIAGVALEKHLKTFCDINGVPYKHKDTIEPLAQALYKEGKLDPTELKKIIYLGGIRNDCAHPNEVSKDQVKALIEQVRNTVG